MTVAPDAAVAQLCDVAAARLTDAGLRARVRAVGERLRRPLQVAVAGAVSGGKSTLVNGLLGRPVAPADAGECTRVVTWYEHGSEAGRVDVELLDGGTRTLALTGDGRLPAELPVPAELVRKVRVQLDLPALLRLTVIDTPGVNTVAVTNEGAARRMVFGTDGTDHAQALIYVLRYVQRFDAATLADFRTLSAACGMTGVNTLAVLSQVDRRGDEADPWPTARRLAGRAYEQLRASVFDVVPVVGLLAETSRARLLGVDDLAALRELAALDELDLDDLLLDVEEFTGSPAFPAPAAVRARLMGCLHRYGIRVATAALRAQPGLGLDGLHAVLLEASGFGTSGTAAGGSVAAGLAHFTERAEQLKALAAIGVLRQLVRSPAGAADRAALADLADAVDEGRPLAASLRGLRVFAALDAVGRGQLSLDDDMLGELMRLAREDTPAAQLGLAAGAGADEVARAARERSTRWRRLVVTTGTLVAGHRARDVLGVFEELAAAGDAAPPRRQVPATGARRPVDAAGSGGPWPVDGPERSAGGRVDAGPEAARLLESPRLSAELRAALQSLLTGADPAAQVGLPAGTAPVAVAEQAAQLAGRFRGLLQRPLPAPDRRAVSAVCWTYESIWSTASGRREGVGDATGS
ncbi:dynamin family protein [Dactylosporangium sp. AC04546]|uniref:dynamin family protein n=1 Tax=Dactylosporangium sp. AC04546 TaxID=2862460 RepID=UPI001EDD3CDB|nr:dynamin family protein [Dactylosporangium sp. AC04546]WVK87100.1 dynamin family protein [Dactylosporangium sp. AC04546]